MGGTFTLWLPSFEDTTVFFLWCLGTESLEEYLGIVSQYESVHHLFAVSSGIAISLVVWNSWLRMNAMHTYLLYCIPIVREDQDAIFTPCWSFFPPSLLPIAGNFLDGRAHGRAASPSHCSLHARCLGRTVHTPSPTRPDVPLRRASSRHLSIYKKVYVVVSMHYRARMELGWSIPTPAIRESHHTH